MKKIFKDVLTNASIAFLSLSASASHAVLKLEVENVTAGLTFFVTDNELFDTDPALGLLSAEHEFDYGSSTVSVGTSKPLGSNSDFAAGLGLLNVVITSATDAEFIIRLTDTDFQLIPDSGEMFASVEGTLGTGPSNTAHFDYYLNTSNGEFDTTGAVRLSSNDFSGSGGFLQNVAPIQVAGIDQPFSLTQIAALHVDAGQTISYDSDLNVVPNVVSEPGILALLGLGLLGMVGGRRFTQSV
ncbi:MAG: PEP-CTERM sorting domain-containing protein [Burkholderiales bacterium]|nr:PEP-CTERM sorting domain-containing protein [Burkholderiales bacterium]